MKEIVVIAIMLEENYHDLLKITVELFKERIGEFLSILPRKKKQT